MTYSLSPTTIVRLKFLFALWVLHYPTTSTMAQQFFASYFVSKQFQSKNSDGHRIKLESHNILGPEFSTYEKAQLLYEWSHNINQEIVTLLLGGQLAFVYDTHAENFYELRPFGGLGSVVHITKPWTWESRVRIEARLNNFYNTTGWENFIRTRLKTGPHFAFKSKRATYNNWSSGLDVEFFLIPNEDFNQRFSDVREITLGLTHIFKNQNAIQFNLLLDKFFSVKRQAIGTGWEFEIGYTF